MVEFGRIPPAASRKIRSTHCPNGHQLRYPNVIVAHWPKPGTGQLVRAWHCRTCKTTIYDAE
jgi:hypothetical protein